MLTDSKLKQPETSYLTLPTPIHSENNSIFGLVQKQAELREFIKFCATPRELRAVKTQRDFARRFGLSEDTLTDWKELPDFWEEVGKEIASRDARRAS